MSRIDDAVERILRVKFISGVFEHPFSDPSLLDIVGCKVRCPTSVFIMMIAHMRKKRIQLTEHRLTHKSKEDYLSPCFSSMEQKQNTYLDGKIPLSFLGQICNQF